MFDLAMRLATPPIPRAPLLPMDLEQIVESVFFDGRAGNGGWTPPMDVTETADEVRVTMDVPGLAPEDIEITLERGNLRIRGERKSEAEDADVRSRRRERRFGWFERVLHVGRAVDPDGVQASVKNGVLRITLRKSEETKPRRVDVRVG